MPHDVFISYSTVDIKAVEAICHILEEQKIRCWYAKRDADTGGHWAEDIMDAIHDCTSVVYLISASSNGSKFTLNELTEAITLDKKIFPVRIEDVMPSKGVKLLLTSVHWMDAISPPFEEHVSRLAKEIQQHLIAVEASPKRETTPPGRNADEWLKKGETYRKQKQHMGAVEVCDRPELTVQFERTRLNAGEWTRAQLKITNSGDAHAFETYVIFSEDFDTKWIKPVTVRAGTTATLEFGVRPRTKGEIPLEISLNCTDENGKKYDHQQEFWIEVIDGLPGMGTMPRPPSEGEPLVSEIANRYHNWTYIGKGGFARVYRARKKNDLDVAVKIPISLDESTAPAFLNEIQKWISLDHENIVKVYDYNILPVPYFEMELCDSSLNDVDRPMVCDEAAWILFNVCEGLKYAHAQFILHQDLKPQNIMLKNGVPKVADWGLSRVMDVFTLEYTSPEQIGEKKMDTRTEIWQLGVILYELVCGDPPFTGKTMVETGMKITTSEPVPPVQVNPETAGLELIILRCLHKDPNRRYQSIFNLQRDLAGYLNMNYAESLKLSIDRDDVGRSAQYCSELMLINLMIGETGGAYRYATDLSNYVRGDVREGTRELTDQIRCCLEEGVTEIPYELMEKARVIDHKVQNESFE
ncbi:TIR domain-containing protein [Methanofollis formosanus]|uniref:TIR domain-containing protein n=1 Tax=Methanofollis formosanus TaxID=299308 RepID=A0A8G1EFP3_9EURY|nr:protein kinase [Methanofollis formosanus]QYZ78077.1 TIR domain-containing protein [Methanofollis formosanus]